MLKRLLNTLIIAIIALLPSWAAAKPSAMTPLPGVVRIKVQPDMARQLKSLPLNADAKAVTGVAALDAAVSAVKGVSLRPVFPCPKGREEEYAKFGLDQWYEISFDTSVHPNDAQRIMKATPGVTSATVKVPMTLYGGIQARVVAPEVVRAVSEMPFNDPRLPAQWHYHNDGSMSGCVAGADINLFEAWKIATGAEQVVVAVIDGGIDTNHEDLKANLWVNPYEIPGNGIDDDGNGYVDDVHGYNFCARNATISAHEHGTHVAGTIAAVNNNGIGVCGVAGGNGLPGSGVRLMSCQVFDSRSGVPDGDFAAAIVYAADNGATIANCSWGWDTENYYEPDVIDAIIYFTYSARSRNMVGGLCIFASGNTGMEGDFYPQAMPEVVSVTAMTHDMRAAEYSSRGEWADITAPGGRRDFYEEVAILSTLPGDKYGYMDGTSMAAPHVTGVAALILAKYGSPTLTNEALRTQLVTSVDDFYAYNPQYTGLFGSGNINAAKALQWSDGEAPETPADIDLYPSQDNIVIKWTIPSTSDCVVDHHILYYSSSPFDAESDLSAIDAVVIDTKHLSSGATMSYELQHLQPLTIYYVAMKAVDRWGHASALSQVLSATTNRGPAMQLLTKEISIGANPQQAVVTSSFEIGNTDEGLLRWTSDVRTKYFPIRLFNNLPQTSEPYRGHISMQKAPDASTVQVCDYVADEYPRSLTNSRLIHAFIGDTDRNLPNSMAQMFTVDADTMPDGFNLTQINVQGSYGEQPIIEVYHAPGAITDANRLLRFEPDFFAYYTNITLPEQLYFAPGESFYIVVHFPGPQPHLYPLGMGLSNGSSTASQAYMSTDMGATWTLLQQVLKGSSYESEAADATWAITAISRNPDISHHITLLPDHGEIRGGDTQTVDVQVDASRLVNGSYSARVHFYTNETAPTDATLPVDISVSGQQPDITFNKIVNFGDLLVGQTKTLKVEVFNKGYGDFSDPYGVLQAEEITSTSEHFIAPEILSGFAARSTSAFDVTYAPKSAGSHSGMIIFRDGSGHELRVSVQGVATDPAKVSITPAEGVDVGTLEVGGTDREVQFTLANTGCYPLQFVMPKYTDETIEGVADSKTHKYGYVWLSSFNGDIQYQPMPQLKNAKDVTDEFGDYTYWSKAVDLGFDFPYYGRKYDKVYISSFGGVAFAPYLEGMMWSPLHETNQALPGTGLISMFGNSQLMMGPDSKVEYGKIDGKFCVSYRNVLASVYDQDYKAVSMHMLLTAEGDVEMYFDDLDAESLFNGCRGLYVALNDMDMADPIVVTSSTLSNNGSDMYSHFGTGTAVKFMAPRQNIVKSVSPAAGVITPGESVSIKATVGADKNMNAGATYTDLVVKTNDPLSPQALVRFRADITGDLHPLMYVAESAVDFGEVFRTAQAQYDVAVKNTGRSELTINSVTSSSDKFTTHFAQPVKVPAGQSRDIAVTLLTDAEGEYEAELCIATDGGNCTLPLSATVIGCPVSQLSYDNVKMSLPYLATEPIPLTITNTGDAAMRYTVAAGRHIDYKPYFGPDCKVTYKYASSVNDANQHHPWIDISADGVHHDMDYYMLNDCVEVSLPFEFPFYDSKYSRIYIYPTGFVAFERQDGAAAWPEPPADFPAGSVFTNLLAPYWGMHSMDSTPDAGTYYKVDSDQVVVSFVKYGNSMNVGVNFQVVIRSDGTFTYTYQSAMDNAVIFSLFGVAGVSNADGSDGISLPARTVAFGHSTNFTPVVENTLEAGASVVADLTLMADEMAGMYPTDITVTTNTPATPTVKIPVGLTVTGKSAPVFPTDTVIEHVKGYRMIDSNDYFLANGAMYYHEFEVENAGSAAFTISSITVDCPSVPGPFGDVKYFTLYTYGHYVDEVELQESTGWHPYKGEAYVVAKDKIRFVVPMLPNSGQGIAYEPGDYPCKITFKLNGVTGMRTKVYNITFRVTDAPVIELSKPEIRKINARDGEVVTDGLTITNSGDYKLEYSYSLYLSGKGDSLADEFAITPSQTGESNNYLDIPVEGEYTEYLYWPASLPSGAYTFGSGVTYSDFKAATRYQGPEGGINIAEIYTMYCPYDLGGKTVKVEIINGDCRNSNDVLGTGTFTVPEGNYKAGQLSFALLGLDHAVYIAEGQEFSVVVTIPAGAQYPMGLIPKKENVEEGRYLAYADNFGDWMDIGEELGASMGSVGYVMTCLEKTPGAPWVKLLGDTTDGTLAVGESADINVQITVDSAPKAYGNKAVIVIRSNDPERPVINFPICLDRNAAPHIGGSEAIASVGEGETLDLRFNISDPDSDAFTFTLYDTHPGRICRVVSVQGIDDSVTVNPIDEGVSYAVGASQGGVEVVVAISPDFGDAGEYGFTVSAVDDSGHESQKAVRYQVQHVNRAPVAVQPREVILILGSIGELLDFNDLFTDPDGDQLAFEASVADTHVVTLYTADTSAIFSPAALGNTVVTVQATDTSGATARAQINVTVNDGAGIDDTFVRDNTAVYPLPATDNLYIAPGFAASEMSIHLRTIGGVEMLQKSTSTEGGDIIILPVQHLTPGIYVLSLECSSGSAHWIVVKK